MTMFNQSKYIEEDNTMSGLEKFKTEIQAEVDKASDEAKQNAQAQANTNIAHLESVCDAEYDGLLNQPHKSFRRMWIFVREKAKERAVDGCAFIDDPTVFGWMDEYVGLDDEEEVEAEEKEEKEKANKKPAKKTAAPKKEEKFDVEKEIKKVQAEVKKQHQISEARQMSIFDLM